MSINFTPSLVEAMDASYTEDTFVRTLGFFAPGDGGAAVYRVTGNVSTPITDKAIQYTDFTLYCSDGEFHLAPDANHPTRSVFEIIPQGNTVYAEQFGVMPGDVSASIYNKTMFHYAAMFSSSEGYTLKFSSKETYYFTDGISLFDDLNIDGSGAVLQLFGSSTGYTFFYKPGSAKNIRFSNISFIGRRTADNGFGDQFLWSRVENLTMKNVRLKNFAYGLRTYTIGISNDYDLPPIVNKNWLIEDCSITDTVMGLQVSEIDGLTIKNSVITSIYPKSFPVGTKGEKDSYDGHDYPEAYIYDKLGGLHNIYMESNCINVRLNNVTMGNVTGDAIHKSYAINQEHDNDTDDYKSYYRFDKSKNHFYTDLSIHKCNAPVNMGFISENVMCDNVFGTNLRYLVHLSAASNCIVSNSSLTVDRLPFDRNGKMINPNTGLYVHSACSCWFQNSYLYTNGRQRVGAYDTEDVHYRLMNIKTPENTLANVDDKKHRRIYIGSDFSIPNHWFKFTGCDIESTYGADDYYFYEVTYNSLYSPASAQFGEYMDNCYYTINTSLEMFRLLAVNDLHGGITYRNCYMKNKSGSKYQPPFRMWCNYPELKDETPCKDNTCPVNQAYGCAIYKSGKKYPWVRFENNTFDNFVYGSSTVTWSLLLKGGRPPNDTHNKPLDEKVPNYLNAYMCNSYKLSSNSFQKLTNLMKS